MSGLLPDAREASEIHCVVRMHESSTKRTDIQLTVQLDDTLMDLKKRVVARRESNARGASELYAWHALKIEREAGVAYIVDMAMESGGTSSIGPRIVTVSHLWETYDRLTAGPAGRRQHRKAGTEYLTHMEAMKESGKVMMTRGEAISVPLGVSHRTTVVHIMTADPFSAEIEVDPNLATKTGDLRDVYETSMKEDASTLETIFKAHSITHNPRDHATHVIDMVCESDLSRYVEANTEIMEEGWRAGFVRKYFPHQNAWKGKSAGDGRDGEAESRAFSVTERVIRETQASLKVDRQAMIAQCVLTSISIRFGQTDARARVSLDQSTGFDTLSRIYNKFRVTRDVPVVRYVNGNESVYKVARIALTAKRVEVSEYLARCTRIAIGLASTVTPSRNRKKPSLHFLMTVGSQSDVAMVQLRQDLSYTVTRTFSTSSVNGGGSFEDVAATHASVNRRIMQHVWRTVNEKGKSSSVVMHEALRDWQDIDNMIGSVGSSLAIGSTFTVLVSEGRVPNLSDLREVFARMFPFFVPVMVVAADGTNTLYLQYRRVDGFGDTPGLLQTMRLLREEKVEVMTGMIARSFGYTYEEASRRVEAELRNGKVPYIQDLHNSGVSLMLKNSNRGISCRINGSTSAVQHRRIVRLVTSAVAHVRSAKGFSFLAWVDDLRDDHEESGSVEKPTSRRRYLHDWEEEDDMDDDGPRVESDEPEDEVIEALLAAELGSARVRESKPVGSRSTTEGESIDESILKEIQRSDPGLFWFNKSGYSTACGAVNGRQPIVVTKEELSRMDPMSYTGAIAYGSTEEAAARNRFICPDVWCPRSRVSMSAQQFVSAGKKCPLATEIPTVLDNEYFKGKPHYVGFLKPSKHPDGLCMPCCFRLPRQRYGMCTASTDPGFYETDETSVESRKEDDPRYLRNEKAHIDDGRYGLIPENMVELLGGVQRCGGREDGSGQMNLHTHCFVRRGTLRHSQVCMSSIIWMLNNPACRDIRSFVGLIAKHLTPDLFVTLNDGRMAKVIMREVIAEEDGRSHGLDVISNIDEEARFVAWIRSSDAQVYVRTSELQGVVAESNQSTGARSMDFRREHLIFTAMTRFVDILRDPSMIKGHEHLLDLCSRPLAWLNPESINILMFEVNEAEGGDEAVYFTCPFDGGHLERHTRLSDPFAMLLRKGSSYHPIVRVQMTRREGVQETRHFHYDTDRFLHQTMYRLLDGCKGSGVDDHIGSLMTGLVAIGEVPGWQVLDYRLRLIGIMTRSQVYVSLPSWTTPLVGHTATGVGTLYIADAMRMHTMRKQAMQKHTMPKHAERTRSPPAKTILDQLRVATGVSSFGSFKEDDGIKLEHLGVFVGSFVEDTRSRHNREAHDRREEKEEMIKRFREALWQDASSASELVFLRHSFNPLPPSARRYLTMSLIKRLIGGRHTNASKYTLQMFVEHILYAPHPLNYARPHAPVTLGALSLTDVDLMSSSLTSLLERGVHSLDGPVSGDELMSLSSNRDVRSGSGSIIFMRKSLYSKLDTLSPSASTASSSRGTSNDKVRHVVTGARMLRCHPWRAMSLAQSLVHTELVLPIDAPQLLMENDRIEKSGNRKPSVPGEPGVHDIKTISRAFAISVNVIRNGSMVAVSEDGPEGCPVLVLAWMDDGSWYVVQSDNGHIMWSADALKKIHSRIQGRQ